MVSLVCKLKWTILLLLLIIFSTDSIAHVRLPLASRSRPTEFCSGGIITFIFFEVFFYFRIDKGKTMSAQNHNFHEAD